MYDSFVIVVCALYIVAVAAGMPVWRWQITAKRGAVCFGTVGIAFYVGAGVLVGPGKFIYAALWLFNTAMAVMTLRLAQRTNRRRAHYSHV